MKAILYSAVALVTLQQVAAFTIDEMACAVNQERRKANKKDLLIATCLCTASNNHSSQMASKRQMAHQLSGESSPGARVSSACGGSVRSSAENIAWNQKDVKAVMQSWMTSSGHRRNILSDSYTHFGAAMVMGNGPYWTQDFASGIQGGRKPNCSGDSYGSTEPEPEQETPAPEQETPAPAPEPETPEPGYPSDDSEDGGSNNDDSYGQPEESDGNDNNYPAPQPSRGIRRRPHSHRRTRKYYKTVESGTVKSYGSNNGGQDSGSGSDDSYGSTTPDENTNTEQDSGYGTPDEHDQNGQKDESTTKDNGSGQEDCPPGTGNGGSTPPPVYSE